MWEFVTEITEKKNEATENTEKRMRIRIRIFRLRRPSFDMFRMRSSP